MRKFEFKFYDLISEKFLGSFEGTKGAADSEFLKLLKKYPDRKLHMKMGAEVK